MAIVKSWFNLVDDDGWVGREQILGPEARSKVPTEFQVQYPHYANPPTLFFILSSYVDKVTAGQSNNPDGRSHLLEKELAQEFLKELYPRLREHYDWFRRTQAGDIKSYDREAFSNREAYRWRGRTVQHLLTSGMDDYPRAQPPHPGELHVDAISWVGVMTDSLRKIAVFLGEEEDGEEFARKAEAVRRNIDDLHWSEEHGVHCDATIDEFEESVAVCHKGYVSIFPFILGLMDPNGKKVGRILDVMADEEELWSVHGIRSLSKQDEYYGKDENYWRGPVWININYLALTQLLVSLITPSPTLPYLLTRLFYRTWRIQSHPTSTKPLPCTRICGEISLRRYSSRGKKQDSRGSSIIRIQGLGSGRSISRGGRVWWCRLWQCRTLGKSKLGMSCKRSVSNVL